MKGREFGLSRCIGEENLAKAIQEKADEGFDLINVVFTGLVQVQPQGGVIAPNTPSPAMASYLVIMARTSALDVIDA